MHTLFGHVLSSERKPLKTDQWLVMALSGGPDSLALAHWLKEQGYLILLAHFDHQIRSTSGRDLEMVKKIADSWKLDLAVGSQNIPERAKQEKRSIEEMGRMARYAFLFSLAEKRAAQAVVTAHTADDQVESVLMHFFRGSGLSGVRGMQYWQLPHEFSTTVPLVRPLLYTWKTEVWDYCNRHGLQPVLDETNADNRYSRNKMRNVVIPQLEEVYPNLKEIILRNSQVAGLEYDWLECELQQDWEYLAPKVSAESMVFSRSKMLTLETGARVSMLRRMMQKLIPEARDFSFQTVLRADHFLCQSNRSQRVELEKTLIMRLIGDEVWLKQKTCRSVSGPGIGLETGQSLCLPVSESWMIPLGDVSFLRGEYLTMQDVSGRPDWKDPWHAFMDCGMVEGSLCIKTWQPGDRFSPAGMNQKSLKMSDFFINVKLPREQRKTWPLLWDARHLLWVPGFQISSRVTINTTTQRILHLWVERPIQ